MRKYSVLKIISGLILVLSIFLSVYIVVNNIGLIDSLDFGAGAYYYADIPDFERFVNSNAYESPVSFLLIITLFLAWGFSMYKFWVYLERKIK